MAYVTFKNLDEAKNICLELVSEKLIACANIKQSHFSIYIWDDQTEGAEEVAATLKFATKNLEAVYKMYNELHSYDTPCFLNWAVNSPGKDYKNWILGE